MRDQALVRTIEIHLNRLEHFSFEEFHRICNGNEN